jgi:hypothetical protein
MSLDDFLCPPEQEHLLIFSCSFIHSFMYSFCIPLTHSPKVYCIYILWRICPVVDPFWALTKCQPSFWMITGTILNLQQGSRRWDGWQALPPTARLTACFLSTYLSPGVLASVTSYFLFLSFLIVLHWSHVCRGMFYFDCTYWYLFFNLKSSPWFCPASVWGTCVWFNMLPLYQLSFLPLHALPTQGLCTCSLFSPSAFSQALFEQSTPCAH